MWHLSPSGAAASSTWLTLQRFKWNHKNLAHMHTGVLYDLTLLMWSGFPLCPFQTANKWFAISVLCIKGLTQPVRSSCLLHPEQLRLSKCICRAAALICSLTGIVNQQVSWCGNQWMRGNCLFHFCNSVSAFLHLFLFRRCTGNSISLNEKPQTAADAEQIRTLVTVPQWQAARCSSLAGLSSGRSESTSTGAQTAKRC